MYFFTKALAEFQHVNCMIVRIWEVKRVACYARAETFTEAVALVASMVAMPLPIKYRYRYRMGDEERGKGGAVSSASLSVAKNTDLFV